MTKNKIAPLHLLIVLLFSFVLFNCSNDDDRVDTGEEQENTVTLNNEVNDFIWNGLNEIYLWKDEIPNLEDSKNDNQDHYYTFLNSYDTPEALFDDLLHQKGNIDKFSFLVDDYIALENTFQGISTSSGLDYSLVRLSDSDDIFGYVRYVANNSDASTKDIKRGDFFLAVDNQQLTIDNFQDLLFGSNTTFTLGMADLTNGSIALNNKTVELTKTEFTEHPILISKVIEESGVKIGYLMYNSFIANFDADLNAAISALKSEGITELVLDLRYNGGGRVSSAIILSSMITGQFNDAVFSKEIWNDAYQSFFENDDPERLINRFTDKLLDDSPITSLNLNKVYILTTSGSASASELVINSLAPYIDVVQIGTATTGKYTASITLYDAQNFDRENANPNHTYALQPLVLKSANVDGKTDFFNGLPPDYLITYTTNSGTQEGENILDLGILGDRNEPFLNKAISLITGTTTKSSQTKAIEGVAIDHVMDPKDRLPLAKSMYKKPGFIK